MQYTDNDTVKIPWGKHAGLTIAELVAKHRKYAELVSKPDPVKERIIQELKTPTQPKPPTQEDNTSWPGESESPF